MGLWDTITDAADAVGDAVSDVAESAYDSVTTSAIGDTIAWAAEAVDTATFGLAGQAMNAADDYVFDTVDYVTGGGVNIDFDDGQFSVGTGFDGLAKVSASVGEAGITTGGEVPFGAYEFGMTDDGFLASGSAGINWGPAPLRLRSCATRRRRQRECERRSPRDVPDVLRHRHRRGERRVRDDRRRLGNLHRR